MAPKSCGLCRADLPDTASQAAFEYYLEGALSRGQKIRFPATAPQLNQTVVIMPSGQTGS